VMGTNQLIININKSEAKVEKTFWLGARRVQFQNTVRSAAGWAAIVGANSGLACLNSPAGCATNTTPPSYTTAQNLNFPIDGITLNGSSPSTGMTNKGDFCNTFNASSGNTACPIGISLKWQVLCDDASCLHGQPKVTIQFQHKDGDGTSENLSTYNLVVYKDPKMETLNEVCVSMGGTLSGFSCVMPQLSAACSPSSGSFVLGFDPLGSVICGRPNPGSCASSDAAIGFDANGGIQCAVACP